MSAAASASRTSDTCSPKAAWARRSKRVGRGSSRRTCDLAITSTSGPASDSDTLSDQRRVKVFYALRTVFKPIGFGSPLVVSFPERLALGAVLEIYLGRHVRRFSRLVLTSIRIPRSG